ncbi:hypothetical protein SAMN06269185_1930 [Natronoarchaeum philippinense]|uniref:EcoRII C terminal n=1 Tax=Natronoarchaeum philippinense TaxID=558529 RepID=A0A285NUA0_NATPI|nr:hypothetical protein [Natronoarchaeum philippinense]SNZ12798.1 hypothetical protein SAMN06269185_1930 [Natronoarchaeum philippinense]
MSEYSGDPSEFKVYWFARDLVASSYGSYATKETETLKQLSSQLERSVSDDHTGNDRSLEEQKQLIRESITGSVNRIYRDDISKRYRQTEDLVERILRRVAEQDDIREFRIAIDAVVRTSEILDTTPSFGESEIVEIVDQTLQTENGSLDPSKAYDALFNVDFEGEAYQLGAQREPLIEYVHERMNELERESHIGAQEVARILSGIVQEYERRAGQSRASTAGNVLETGLQHIFNQFDIPATNDQAHFGDLEVDNKVAGPEGAIGFSCKRTLRERFRQSLSREAEIGVDEIWFVSLLMADVSREKVEDISNDGGRIYVPRDSFVWNRYSDIDDLSYTLRPADQFLEDIVEFTAVTADL